MSPLQLPPLSEVLGDVSLTGNPDLPRQTYDQSSASRDRPPNFPVAQSLAPSPGRLRPSYASTSSAYPSESSVSSEYSDRRSSYASPSSSASLASTRASPVLPPVHQYPPPHRGTAPEYANMRGLPSLYTGPDPAGRGAASPTRSAPYPSPYGPPQEYVGPYQRVSPHQGTGPHAGYGVGFDSMGEYGEGKHQKRRRGNLPKVVTDILRQWFHDHIAHPYPTEDEKQSLMHQTGLSMSQISNWFINARRRSLPTLQRPPTDPHPP